MVKTVEKPLSVVTLKSNSEINTTNEPKADVSMLIMHNDKQLAN
jgi:hypothetical protein